MYVYDVNTIIAEPLNGKTAGEIARAHQRLYTYLTDRGLKPNFGVLDNECSEELVRVMTKKQNYFPISTSTPTQNKRHRTSNTHMKEPLHSNCVWFKPKISTAIIGQVSGPNKPDSYSTTSRKIEP